MKKITRRKFLKTSAASAAVVTIVPRHVLGGSGFTPPSDKLNIALIGCGGIARKNLQAVEHENIVALCDVDERRAADTFKKYPNLPRYTDFRRMLDKQKDIDAVIVSTPDHTHAVATMAAIEREKHVYCEKPLTHSIAEARKITAAARAAGVATQMGNQGHSLEPVRLFCEWIWDGAIGPVREVHAWCARPLGVWPFDVGMMRPTDTPVVPSGLTWNLWLGPAPFRSYHPCYLPGAWRGWVDFGSGALGDLGCHLLDPVFWALDLKAPESVEASTTIHPPAVASETFPYASIVKFLYPARGNFPAMKLTWYDGGLKPERPPELEEGRDLPIEGVLVIGDKGKIIHGLHGADGARIIPETKMQAYKPPPKTIPRVPGHHQDWLNACKGGDQASGNFNHGGALTEMVLLGVLAVRLKRKLFWNSTNMSVLNDDEANGLVSPEYRKGWKL